jgi:hypothetical protein
MEGPKAEVKQFPKERIVRQPSETTEAGGLEKLQKSWKICKRLEKTTKIQLYGDFLC